MDLPALLSDALGLNDPEMQRAAVTGIFQMAGVVITGLVAVATFALTQRATRRRDTQQHLAAIERERKLREERIRDIQTARLADIKSYPHRVSSTDLDKHFELISRQIESATLDEPFTPFVPREAPTQLWTPVAKEVHILPTEVIDPVVSFFGQVEAIALFADDLRSERFTALSRPRKITMYRDYIELKKYAATLAVDAQQALLTALGLPVSSPVLAQSVHQPASEEAASVRSGHQRASEESAAAPAGDGDRGSA